MAFLGRDRHGEIARIHDQFVPIFSQFAGEEVHGGGADETSHEKVVRVIVQMLRRIKLLQNAFIDDGDTGCHRHGFGLVVGHVDECGLQALVQLADLRPHCHAQFCIQVGERLIEQEDLWLADDRASHRHTLALTTG